MSVLGEEVSRFSNLQNIFSDERANKSCVMSEKEVEISRALLSSGFLSSNRRTRDM